MDLLGLRWARWGLGSPGRYSIGPKRRLPVGRTPNDVLASRVSRVDIGTAVLLPALRNPVLLAHQVATLDQVAEDLSLLLALQRLATRIPENCRGCHLG